MIKKITLSGEIINVNWTPDSICNLFKEKSVSFTELLQSNKSSTNKFIRDLYILACIASLETSGESKEKANLLNRYARNIKRISNDYEKLFRREDMNEECEDAMLNNIDRMQARLFYLTTQFTVHPCTNIAGSIVELLNKLCRHPQIELLPAQRYIYSQSLNYWRSKLIRNADEKKEVVLH